MNNNKRYALLTCLFPLLKENEFKKHYLNLHNINLFKASENFKLKNIRINMILKGNNLIDFILKDNGLKYIRGN